VWKEKKINVATDKAITILPPFKVELEEKQRLSTNCDMIGHLVDYLNVCSDNERIQVGIYLGKLIEKHPRIKTITHYKRLVYKNKLLLLFHYEIKHWEHRGFEGRDKDRFRYDEVYHFFGHSHSKPDTKFDRWCLDVGIDCSECKILSFEEQMSRAKK
jgi:calcineurin-like phosphoesterase family protein